MAIPRIRVMKDFRKYFVRLSQCDEVNKNELNMIAADYKDFYDNVVYKFTCHAGKLDSTNVTDVCRNISTRLHMVNLYDNLDIRIRDQMNQLYHDLFQ